jgi:Protein of unknown function (DUF3768)
MVKLGADVPQQELRMQLTQGSISATIRFLNDNHRLQLPSGQVFLTAGIAALDDRLKAKVLQAVRLFTAFTEDNDPHGEHDFGSFEIGDEKVFWKIDYYDNDMSCGSENPADPAVTKRVLTIMLAEEY